MSVSKYEINIANGTVNIHHVTIFNTVHKFNAISFWLMGFAPSTYCSISATGTSIWSFATS